MLGSLVLPKSPENRKQAAPNPHFQEQHLAPVSNCYINNKKLTPTKTQTGLALMASQYNKTVDA